MVFVKIKIFLAHEADFIFADIPACRSRRKTFILTLSNIFCEDLLAKKIENYFK